MVLLAQTVFIAAGVGAFQPRRLKVEGLERFDSSQVCYQKDSAGDLAGKDVVVVGGDEHAVAAAVDLASPGGAGPRSVTLLHRREALQAPDGMLAAFRQACEARSLRFRVGQVTGFEALSGRLAAVQVTDGDGQTNRLPVDAMLVLQGLSPRLGPVAQWGMDMERRQLKVDTEKFSTSLHGIFAVGDINTYPGKKKLILSGFHESALAAFGAAEIVFPDRKIALQYTTASPRLHQLLGVAPASSS